MLANKLQHEYRNKTQHVGDKTGKRKAGGNFPLFVGVAKGALKSVYAKWCQIFNYTYDSKGSKQTLEA